MIEALTRRFLDCFFTLISLVIFARFHSFEHNSMFLLLSCLSKRSIFLGYEGEISSVLSSRLLTAICFLEPSHPVSPLRKKLYAVR